MGSLPRRNILSCKVLAAPGLGPEPALTQRSPLRAWCPELPDRADRGPCGVVCDSGVLPAEGHLVQGPPRHPGRILPAGGSPQEQSRG